MFVQSLEESECFGDVCKFSKLFEGLEFDIFKFKFILSTSVVLNINGLAAPFKLINSPKDQINI